LFEIGANAAERDAVLTHIPFVGEGGRVDREQQYLVTARD
jgi:hypothetical protein